MSKSAKRKLRNIHPGQVLREEFLVPLRVTQYRLAKEIGVTEARFVRYDRHDVPADLRIAEHVRQQPDKPHRRGHLRPDRTLE